jgi:hypothetical protein
VIDSRCLDEKEITMAWTEITRKDYERRGGRYASDMPDGEWGVD